MSLKRSVPCTNCGAPVFWHEVEPEEPLCSACMIKMNKQTTEWLKHLIEEAEKKRRKKMAMTGLPTTSGQGRELDD